MTTDEPNPSRQAMKTIERTAFAQGMPPAMRPIPEMTLLMPAVAVTASATPRIVSSACRSSIVPVAPATPPASWKATAPITSARARKTAQDINKESACQDRLEAILLARLDDDEIGERAKSSENGDDPVHLHAVFANLSGQRTGVG